MFASVLISPTTLPVNFLTRRVVSHGLESGAGPVRVQVCVNSAARRRVADLPWPSRLYRPKSAPSSQPSANGVQTEGLDYDRLKQVGLGSRLLMPPAALKAVCVRACVRACA